LLRASQEFILRKITKKLEEQLHRAHKMEAIARLAGGVPHDFNNILTAITGYSGVLVSSYDEENPLPQTWKKLKRPRQGLLP
jgi:two-component system cell cycle sensor histidine kinase/response regulator CckA